MKTRNSFKTAFSALGLTFALAATAHAQRPDGAPKGGRPDGAPGGREGMMRGGDPSMMADMMIKRFDKDGDQKLSREELLTAMEAIRQMGGPGGFGGGPGASGPGASGPGGLAGGPGVGGPQMMGRMFEQNDADGDGKLSGDEIPERMRQGLARIDTNGDGAVDKSEMAQMMKNFGGGNRPGRDGGEGNRTPKRPPVEE